MQSRGFTLIELMITMAVLAIIASFAAPGITNLVADSRLSNTTSEVVTLLKFARSEAMRRNEAVQVSPLGMKSGNDQWGDGIVVWLDTNHNSQRDAAETLGFAVVNYRSLNLTVKSDNPLHFNARGEANVATNLTVSICDQRHGETGRQITIMPSGLVALNNAHPCDA